MSRQTVDDYLQNFRFRVGEVEGGLGVLEKPAAGFNTVTTPELTIEQAEHRTGIERYTKKLAGVPTWGDGTMTRGIMLGDTVFYDWVVNRYLNRQPFRADLQVDIFNQEVDGTIETDTPSRSEIWRECWPNSVKLMGDLDASASDANLQEITVSLEKVELVAPAAGDIPGLTPSQ